MTRANAGPRDPLAEPEALIRHVFVYVSYRVRNREDAEDITSETFERAYRYRNSFDPDRGSAFAWITGIAERCIAAAALKRRDDVHDVPDMEAPDDLGEDGPRRLTLVRAIGELADRDRRLIALRFGEDLSAKQMASLLGMKTNAVEVALHRALERLRAVLDGEDMPAKAAAGESGSARVG